MTEYLFEHEPALTKGQIEDGRAEAGSGWSTRYTNQLSEAFIAKLASNENESWVSEAACHGKQSIMFDHFGEKKQEKARRVALAKEICRKCPVIEQCLDAALLNHESGAVWGGMTDDERDGLKRKRNVS